MKSNNPLHILMNPRSIVFLGASNSIMTIGTPFLLNIIRGGYRGKVFPVHPREKTILGLPAYPNIASLPETPDLAFFVISKKMVPKVFKSCAEKGVKRAVVVTAGYEEIDSEEGARLQNELDRLAKRYGIRYLGPNCMGIINTGISLNTTWFPYKHSPGTVGFVSQSGSYVTQTLPYFARAGLGLSKAISVGNQADIDMIDCLEYLGQDSGTTAIAMYIEDIRRPRAFLELARKITPKKPIVALYVGGTEAGSRASASHTAAMSGSEDLYNGLFRQAGVLRAKSFPELFDSCLALSSQPLPKGNKMAILTNSGGPAITMADACNRYDLEVPLFDRVARQNIKAIIPKTASPNNPVDVTLNYDPLLIFAKLPDVILDLPYIDGMLFYGIFGPVHLRDKKELAGDILDIPIDMISRAMEKACRKFIQFPERLQKPILCCSFNGREDESVAMIQDGGIPVYPSPERAVQAMASLHKYARIKSAYSKN